MITVFVDWEGVESPVNFTLPDEVEILSEVLTFLCCERVTWSLDDEEENEYELQIFLQIQLVVFATFYLQNGFKVYSPDHVFRGAEDFDDFCDFYGNVRELRHIPVLEEISEDSIAISVGYPERC